MANTLQYLAEKFRLASTSFKVAVLAGGIVVAGGLGYYSLRSNPDVLPEEVALCKEEAARNYSYCLFDSGNGTSWSSRRRCREYRTQQYKECVQKIAERRKFE